MAKHLNVMNVRRSAIEIVKGRTPDMSDEIDKAALKLIKTIKLYYQKLGASISDESSMLVELQYKNCVNKIKKIIAIKHSLS